VELISENTSLYDMRHCGNRYFRLWCVYCVPCCVPQRRISYKCIFTDQFHNIVALARLSISSLRMVQLDRNMLEQTKRYF